MSSQMNRRTYQNIRRRDYKTKVLFGEVERKPDSYYLRPEPVAVDETLTKAIEAFPITRLPAKSRHLSRKKTQN